jgi:hypothetical protein
MIAPIRSMEKSDGQDALLGVLVFDSRKRNAFNDERDRHMAMTLAEQLSHIIRRIAQQEDKGGV